MLHLKSRDIGLTLREDGYLSSVLVMGEETLKAPSPLVTLCVGGEAFKPVRLTEGEDALTLSMENGDEILLSVREGATCVCFTVLSAPKNAYAVVFGPAVFLPDDTIGDVLGVLQGGEIAVGMLSLNAKTLEGVPQTYAPAYLAMNDYRDGDTGISTGGMKLTERAATGLAGGGAVMHFFCKDRMREEYAPVMGAENALILPMPGSDPDATIPGAGICFFGSPRKKALERIGEIELELRLPHPLIDGEWEKTSRKAMQSYLISEFTRDEIDLVLSKAALAGMRTIYHSEPFKTWGHFEWRDDLASSDADFKKNVTDKAKARGIKVGLHTLTNFTTTNDPYVTPVPSAHLLKLAKLELISDIGKEDTEIRVRNHPCLSLAQTLNAVQAGDEIFTFQSVHGEESVCKLLGVTRGAFGTAAGAHEKSAPLYLLRDYPYKTLFPDLALQDEYSARIVELFNATGASQISYDGYEGCSYTGHDLYAPTRFLTRCYEGFDHFVLNDGSGLHHFGWHISTRMNWGEPWGEAMRTGQVAARIRNQDFYRRNLFPRMLGWFLLRIAEKRFEASTREDLEWALSEAAGFDAGYSMTIHPRVMRKLGNIDQFLSLIREWDLLREADAFSQEQKARLRLPENEFRLEKESEGVYTLYGIQISKPYVCALSEMQPGQPGGADWPLDNPLSPSFAFRLRVDGDGAIRNPMFKTETGALRFPCEIEEGQYLLYDFDGSASVTDKNYNVLRRVTPVGAALLPRGRSALAFSCDHDPDDAPEVVVRFITRDGGERVLLKEGQ